MRLQSLIAMLSEFPMIHLVRSPSHSDSRAQSSAPNPIAPSGSVVRLFPKSTLQSLEDEDCCDDGVDDTTNDITNDITNDTMASRALVVLENLGESYPVETSNTDIPDIRNDAVSSTADNNTADNNTAGSNTAVTPALMSPSMQEMYQYLTVQKVTFDSPALKTTVLETPQPLPADTKFLYAYPQQFLQAPSLPVRARHRLPALPFLEMGSGLLAFTIVSGVVIADGLKQAKNTPAPGKKAAPISSLQTDRAKRSTSVNVAMSDMEILKSGRTLPLPANAGGAPLGSSMTTLTPAQMSQLAMQQAIAASQVGQVVEPPTSIIPPLKTFTPPQTANPAPVQQPREEEVKPQRPQPPISMTPPPQVRSMPIVQESIVPMPIVQESIAPKLPVPQIPSGRSVDVPVQPPVAVTEPSPVPTPTPMSPTVQQPTVQQSMVPTSTETPAANVPILNVPILEGAPRQMQSEQPEALPTRTTQEKAMVPEAPLTLTPRVLSSMRPAIQEEVVTPKAATPTVKLEVEPKDLVFNREASVN
jgi:hypothetical protein